MAGEEQLVTTLRMRVRNVDDAVIQQAVHDSMVITIPIDSSLSVSGAAADALAVGNALGGKASLADVRGLLSVDGRTGNGSWAITLNGSDIPATEDTDEESVADALERLALADTGIAQDLADEISNRETAESALETRIGTQIGTEATARADADTALGGRIDTEAAARADADTALDGRLDVLEAKKIVLVSTAFTSAHSKLIPVTGITADHELIGYQFIDSSSNATGEILADLAWTTGAGSVEVTFSNVRGAGSVRMIFGVPEDITPQEVSS